MTINSWLAYGNFAGHLPSGANAKWLQTNKQTRLSPTRSGLESWSSRSSNQRVSRIITGQVHISMSDQMCSCVNWWSFPSVVLLWGCASLVWVTSTLRAGFRSVVVNVLMIVYDAVPLCYYVTGSNSGTCPTTTSMCLLCFGLNMLVSQP
jgi:hypothetical protein